MTKQLFFCTFRSATSLLFGDRRGWQDSAVYDAVSQGHGPEHPYSDLGPANLIRSDQSRQKDDSDNATKKAGKTLLVKPKSNFRGMHYKTFYGHSKLGVRLNQRNRFPLNVCRFPLPARLQWVEPPGGRAGSRKR